MEEHKQFQIQPVWRGNNQKPLDIGNGQLSASIGANGLISSINRPHTTQGYITLTPIAQFPNDNWYDSEFVRVYRRQLFKLSEIEGQWNGFGLKVDHPFKEQQASVVDDKNILLSYQGEGIEWNSFFEATEVNGKSYVINTVEINNLKEEQGVVNFSFGGKLSLNRCSYGQLTEAGPIPIPDPENKLIVGDNHLSMVNRHLPAYLDVYIYVNNRAIELTQAEAIDGSPLLYTSKHQLTIEPNVSATIKVVYALGEKQEEQGVMELGDYPIYSLKELNPKREKTKLEEFIIKRNINYILSCCSVPIDEEYTCVITDHQLLPLAWNRDAYYMIQLLFEADKKFPGRYDVQDIIKGHLLWMFEKADRPERYWGRAYLTNGYCKDLVFQLDQQCYPLLQLCDYYNTFEDTKLVERIKPKLKEILEMILEYKAEEHWLFKTGETPADDKVDYPYHFSSQVLTWYTLQQLHELNVKFDFYPEDLSVWAMAVKKHCLEGFTTEYQGKKLFAYLTDLNGNYQFYHDANDLPTVFAPEWKFCDVDDEVWLNTLFFGFSEENKGGFYTGNFGGLGSVHTPHPWPLGDGQELLFSILTKDNKRQEKVLKKLEKLVQWDGMFCEAVDKEEGTVTSRYWFSWPGAFISYVLLQK